MFSKRTAFMFLFALIGIAGCVTCHYATHDLFQVDIRYEFAGLLKLFRRINNYEQCDERVQIARDVDEALRMFDEHLLPTLEDKSEVRLRRLRNRISSKKSWVYCFEGHEYTVCYLLNIFPELRNGQYGFNYFVSEYNKATGKYNPEDENHGFLVLTGSSELCSSSISENEEYAYEKVCQKFIRLTGPSSDDEPCFRFDNSDIIAVVDVVDVQLLRVSGFERVRLYGSKDCFAEYLVRLDVRVIEKGFVDCSTIMLEARLDWSDFGWMYYRGMTLRVGFHKRGSEYVLDTIKPTLPYEPFSDADIVVSGGIHAGNDWSEVLKGQLSPLVVQYGKHTKIEFRHGEIINSAYRGSFPDFGVTASVKILELSEDSNKEFWEDAWFIYVDECYIYRSSQEISASISNGLINGQTELTDHHWR